MIICKLQGGLGNQLFEYSTAYSISKARHEKLMFDISSYSINKLRKYELDNYSISAPILNDNQIHNLEKKISIYKKLHIGKKYYVGIEKIPHIFQDISKASYLNGYYQHIKYFDDIRDDLVRDIKCSWTNSSDDELGFLNYWYYIINNNESVAMHVRRTDYLEIADWYKTLDVDYYKKAMDCVKEKINNPLFIVFSDDIEWCKQQEIFLSNDYVKIVDSSGFNNTLIDFELMRKCKHYIIANSTYSWWAAYLSENDSRILISPSEWFVSPDRNINLQSALLRDYFLI